MTGARTPSPGRPRPRRSAAGLRRWPEFTAAGLVLALGLGLGSLLLDGQRAPQEVVVAAPPTSAIPVSPGAVTGASSSATASAASPAAQTTAGTIPPAPATPPAPKIPPPVLPEPRRLPAPPTPAKPEAEASAAAAPASQPAAAEAQKPETQAPEAQRTETQRTEAQAPTPAAAPPAQPQAEAPATSGTGTPAQSEPAPTPAPAAGAPAVPPSAQRTPLRSEYRVMLGTFGSEAALRSATAGVGALGYTVYAIDLGNQFVAQVGPFPDEATGQQAAADIRRAYARAELYPPRGRTLQNPAQAAAQAPTSAPDTAASAASAPADESAQQAEAADTPAPLPAPAGPVYVQVGAFNNVEGAQRFVEQLRAQGFTPSVNAPETGKVTVLLGPLSGDALLAAEGRLDAAGLDHFRLR